MLDRPDLIGASDVSAVLGLSTWTSRGDLWARIVHGSRWVESEPAYWGTALESAVAERFERDHQVVLRRCASIVHPRGRVWQRVSLDRALDPGGVVEIKTCSEIRARELGAPGTDEILTEHYVQVQAQLEAVGAHTAWVPYLVAGQDYREYVVRPEPEVQAAIIEACERFWRDHVMTKIPPPSDSPETLAKIWPRVARDRRPTTPDEDRAIAYYALSRKLRETAEEEEARAKAAVLSLVTDARGLDGFAHRVTWAECRRRGTIDWRAVAQAVADRAGVPHAVVAEIANECTGDDTHYRSLRVTERKEK